MEHEIDELENEINDLMEFDKLGLYYEVHMAGIDGENMTYSIYFEDSVTDEKFDEINKTVSEFKDSYLEKDRYPGYIDVSKGDDRVDIYLDIGNVESEDSDTIVREILKVLNNISGIRTVILNEDCDFDF